MPDRPMPCPEKPDPALPDETGRRPKTNAWWVRLVGSHLDPEESNGEFGEFERMIVCRFLAEYADLLDGPGDGE